MDRRILKSEEAIMAAFLELMKRKELDKISISEIAKEANVNRGTIYLRYTDKYDLFHHFIEFQLKNLMDSCYDINQQLGALTKEELIKTFEYFNQKKDILKIVLSDHGMPLFCNKMKEEIINKLTFQGTALETPRGVKEIFVSSAVVGVLEWWLKDNRVTSTEVANELWPLLKKLYEG